MEEIIRTTPLASSRFAQRQLQVIHACPTTVQPVEDVLRASQPANSQYSDDTHYFTSFKVPAWDAEG